MHTSFPFHRASTQGRKLRISHIAILSQRGLGRSLAIALVLGTGLTVLSQSAAAQGAIQVLGEYRYGSFIGVRAYVTMQTGTNQNGHYTAGPTGFKSRNETQYIESGPSRYLNSTDGKIHPYGAGYDKNGIPQVHVDTGTVLGSGLQYQYYSNRISGTTYQSVFCSGSGCEQMVRVDTGFTSLDALDSGGEGQDSSSHWGVITTKYNNTVVAGTSNYVPWCWNWPVSKGTSNAPSHCFDPGDGHLDSWTASY